MITVHILDDIIAQLEALAREYHRHHFPCLGGPKDCPECSSIYRIIRGIQARKEVEIH